MIRFSQFQCMQQKCGRTLLLIGTTVAECSDSLTATRKIENGCTTKQNLPTEVIILLQHRVVIATYFGLKSEFLSIPARLISPTRKPTSPSTLAPLPSTISRCRRFHLSDSPASAKSRRSLLASGRFHSWRILCPLDPGYLGKHTTNVTTH